MASSQQQREALDELSLAPKKRNDYLPEYLLPYRQPVCAYLASVYAIGVGFPLDSIKTRQQTYRYKNVWQCVVETRKTEGIRGFYRGLIAPLLSSAAVRAMSVSMFNLALPYTSSFFYRIIYNEGASSNILSKVPVAFSAGMFAGVSCTPIACPFEYTKLASQIDILVRPKGVDNVKPQSTFRVARNLVSHGGFRALFSGWKLHAFRDMLGSGIYFTVYESAKSGLSKLLKSEKNENHPATAIALAGAMAGSTSWSIIYPIDTYKSMVQRDLYAKSMGVDSLLVQKPGMSVADIKKKGIKGLYNRKMYRGLVVSLARTSIMGMMFFSSYEWLIKHV